MEKVLLGEAWMLHTKIVLSINVDYFGTGCYSNFTIQNYIIVDKVSKFTWLCNGL